jgi:hypothetical protein
MSAQYFAQLDETDTVVKVAVVTSEFMAENPDRYTGRWVETFFDTAGKTYAGVGFIYIEERQDFIPPILPAEPEVVNEVL